MSMTGIKYTIRDENLYPLSLTKDINKPTFSWTDIIIFLGNNYAHPLLQKMQLQILTIDPFITNHMLPFCDKLILFIYQPDISLIVSLWETEQEWNLFHSCKQVEMQGYTITMYRKGQVYWLLLLWTESGFSYICNLCS